VRAFAQSIVETVRYPLVVLDANLKVRKANSAFYRAIGLPPEETEGRPVCELGPGVWESPQLGKLLAEVAANRSSLEELEVEHQGPAGRQILLISARRVLHDDGTPMVLLTLDDVTERVTAREELRLLNRELEDRVRERTARLEAANRELEAFCSSVSHDLRAPLRALDGFSEELLRTYSGKILDEKGQHYLQRLRAGSQRMGQLIDELLQLSRISRGELKRERVDLSALASSVAAELKQQEPARQVAFEIQPSLWAQGDGALLRVVLENLLSNSWKFTSRKPSATIRVGRAEHPGALAFFVQDDGAGFDMAHSSKLFGAFQRLHTVREFPGHGVGLATVQRVIHRHGGTIWAEGAPGRGATFTFTLPGTLPGKEGP
jgi:PAS domain S-box-containing protein